jgi:hypothetical protein
MRLLPIAALVCAIAIASSKSVFTPPSSQDDAAILSIVLAHLCAPDHDERSKKLSAQTFVVRYVPSSEEFDGSAVASLRGRNNEVHSLPPLSLCPALSFIPSARIEAAAGDAGWPGLHQRSSKPVRMIYLSLPGYSFDGSSTIVELREWSGAHTFWVVRKVEGKWELYKSVPGPVS